MDWVSKLFRLVEAMEPSESYVMRGGKPRKTDAVFEAWTSGDLSKMLAALNTPTHPVDRHHLLQSIVELTYKERNKDSQMRQLCEQTARTHLRACLEIRF